MSRGLTLVFTLGLCACAGGALATSLSANSPSPAPDVFGCIRQQIRAVGFTQQSYDEDELRVTARKYNEKVRRPSVQFRRLIDRITFDVGPGNEGVTTISAVAATFAESATHRGPTEEQERTSETAKQAAQAILDRCGAAS